MQKIENKLYNSSLEIEELKEEVSNCMETIEKYREKYGDLKNVKNRAIEMEIKECLRWI
jgi:predicted ATP-grasp superfamily ATP-dependent carboligase